MISYILCMYYLDKIFFLIREGPLGCQDIMIISLEETLIP